MAKKKVIQPKTETFKVTKEFTFDKVYKVGSKIELSDEKIKNTLIANKLIK